MKATILKCKVTIQYENRNFKQNSNYSYALLQNSVRVSIWHKFIVIQTK